MNKYSKKAIVYFGAAMLILLSPAVYSRNADNARGGNAGFNKQQDRQKFLDSLNLTGEQKEKLKEQNAEYKDKNKELRSQLRAKRRELRDKLNKDTIDKDKIDAIVSEISVLSEKQIKQMVDRIISTKEILTPEQFKKFQEKVKNVRKRIKQRYGNKNGMKGSFGKGM